MKKKKKLKTLQELNNSKLTFDVIFLDPPYKTDYAIKSVEKILEYDLLSKTGMIIIETDIEEEILPQLKMCSLDIFDVKKYGRVTLIFARRKG